MFLPAKPTSPSKTKYTKRYVLVDKSPGNDLIYNKLYKANNKNLYI